MRVTNKLACAISVVAIMAFYAYPASAYSTLGASPQTDKCKTFSTTFDNAMQEGIYVASQAATIEFDKVTPLDLKNECVYGGMMKYMQNIMSFVNADLPASLGDLMKSLSPETCNILNSFAKCLPFPNISTSLNTSSSSLSCNFTPSGLASSALGGVPTGANTNYSLGITTPGGTSPSGSSYGGSSSIWSGGSSGSF